MSSPNAPLSSLSSLHTMIKNTFKAPRTPQLLSIALATSLIIGGSVLAQSSLLIPTNLNNARIAITDIFLSPSGTDTSSTASIKLDGTNGAVQVQNGVMAGGLFVNGHSYLNGTSELSGTIQLNSYPCTSTSGCVLTVNSQGMLNITGDLSSFVGGSTTNNNGGSTTSGDKESFFAKRGDTPTDTGATDIYFASPALVNTGDGNIRLRVGINDTAFAGGASSNSQIVTKDSIESRKSFKVVFPHSNNIAAKRDINLAGETNYTRSEVSTESVTSEAMSIKSTSYLGSTPDKSNIILGSYDASLQAKVGVNTPVGEYPSKTLDVRGDAQIVMTAGQETTIANNNSYMYFQNTGTTSGNSYSKLGAYFGTGLFASTPLRLQTAGGRVAIGDVDPQAKLHVAGNLEIDMPAGQGSVIKNGYTYMYFGNSSTTSGNSYSEFGSYFGDHSTSTYAATALRLQIAGGNVSIGAFDPQAKLHVGGDVRADAYYYNSDRRYKSDITLLDNALDKILSLNGYSFIMKATKKASIGIIAQEVEKVFPQVVKTDKDGYKSVEYGNLIAPVIEAIKSLNIKIEDLFDRYLEQQDTIEALEARIADLEKKIQ